MSFPLMKRRTNHLRTSADAVASSRKVQICKPGGQVDGDQSTTATITVHSGHGVATGDKFMVGTDESKFFTAGTITETTIPLATGTVSVTDGDLIVNLGSDTGTTAPEYDDTDVPVYADLDDTSALSNSQRTTDSNGEYEYFTTDERVWELVLDSSDAAGTIFTGAALTPVQKVLELEEVPYSPDDPTQDTKVNIYLKGDKFIISFDHGGTMKYRSLDLTSTDATWDYGVSEP